MHSFVLWFFFLPWLGNLAQNGKEYMGNIPLQNPDLFGGDILGIEDPEDRNAIIDKRMIWPGGIVPYELDPALSTYESQFLGAWYLYRKDTCIRFIKRTNEKDYIRIFRGQGCYSHVGKTGGAQPVSIGQGCNLMGTVLHELGHAIGFFHEQNRSDRDDWLTIYWENIKEGAEANFIKLKPEQHQLITEFDYDSIMLYGEYAFSKEYYKLKTMVPKKSNKPLKEVGWKNLSKADITRIKKLYGCEDYVYKKDGK
ncbi:astacin-like metalloprotease toxin 1 [Trichonephila clavipes]|nr:astacin-like metalloprotease toxin 1 [Trichonephila clavipes]